MFKTIKTFFWTNVARSCKLKSGIGRYFDFFLFLLSRRLSIESVEFSLSRSAGYNALNVGITILHTWIWRNSASKTVKIFGNILTVENLVILDLVIGHLSDLLSLLLSVAFILIWKFSILWFTKTSMNFKQFDLFTRVFYNLIKTI